MRRLNKKLIVAAVACSALIVGSISSSLAWLVDKTEEVTNTFTASDINVELTETGMVDNVKSFKMIPGHTITKDPKVKVLKDSEDCYLFVKLEKSDNFDSFLTYQIADGWSSLENESNVYYRKILACEDQDSLNNQDEFYSVLANDQVTVNQTVTKEDMNDGFTAPTLIITAYASQLMRDNDSEFTPAQAWKNVNDPETVYTDPPATDGEDDGDTNPPANT